jgi:TIR domain
VSAAGAPRVFISYAHEPSLDGHRARALTLAQSLRLRGVEATIDQFVEHDPPTWPRWMADEIRCADFVLCLASPLYKERVEGRGSPNMGRGARWEGAVITEEIYSAFPAAQSRFVAVLLEGCSPDHIPDVLMPVGRSYYQWPLDDEDLYRRLTNQPKVVPALLGSIVRLDPIS